MSRNLERVITGALSIVFIAIFFVMGRSGANATIDNAQATASAAQNALSELLDAPKPPDLSDDLASALDTAAVAQEQVYLLETQVADLLALPTNPPATDMPTLAPTATAIPSTATPEYCYPSDLFEVVVIRDPRLNLWHSLGDNAAGKPIMDIYEDADGNRVQYTIGVTFFVYEELVTADGGGEFYEVFGPLGKGLFVKGDHIKLFNDEPALNYCSS